MTIMRLLVAVYGSLVAHDSNTPILSISSIPILSLAKLKVPPADFLLPDPLAESGTRFSFNLVQLPVNVTGYLKKRRNHASCVAPTSDGYSKLFIYGGTYQLGASVPSEDDLPFFLYDEKGN